MSADRSAKARAIAADAYVGKPLDFEALVRQHPQRRRRGAPRSGPAAADSAGGVRR